MTEEAKEKVSRKSVHRKEDRFDHRVFKDLEMSKLSFGRIIRLHARPLPISSQQIVSLSQSSRVSPVEVTDRKGVWGGREAESYDRKKAWPSINCSMRSVFYNWLARHESCVVDQK